MKSVLFYWGKGSEVRRKIISILVSNQQKNEPSYLNQIANQINQSHVTTRRHLEIMREEGYLVEQNPGGKPTYLQLTTKGKEIAKELNFLS